MFYGYYLPGSWRLPAGDYAPALKDNVWLLCKRQRDGRGNMRGRLTGPDLPHHSPPALPLVVEKIFACPASPPGATRSISCPSQNNRGYHHLYLWPRRRGPRRYLAGYLILVCGSAQSAVPRCGTHLPRRRPASGPRRSGCRRQPPNHTIVVKSFSGSLQNRVIIPETNAHINQLDAIIIDLFQALSELGKIASPLRIEDLHRRECHLRRPTDEPNVFMSAAIIPATCVPWPLSSAEFSPWACRIVAFGNPPLQVGMSRINPRIQDGHHHPFSLHFGPLLMDLHGSRSAGVPSHNFL